MRPTQLETQLGGIASLPQQPTTTAADVAQCKAVGSVKALSGSAFGGEATIRNQALGLGANTIFVTRYVSGSEEGVAYNCPCSVARESLGISSMIILVTGASGSGTSTLGAVLAAALGVAHLEADDYYWHPTVPLFINKRDRSERLSSLVADLQAKQNAVLAGSVVDWGHEVENAFDLIVFLYVDAEVRVERLKRREIERFGTVNPAFLEWAAQYDEGPPEGRSLAKHRAWLEARRCPVIELRGNLSVGEHVAAVLREAPNLPIEMPKEK
jgi:hypothetical protein